MPDHEKSVKDLLALIGQVTRWGSSVDVIIGYHESRNYVEKDESVGSGRFFYTAAVTVCGRPKDQSPVTAWADTLERALLNLANEVVASYRRYSDSAKQNATQAQLDIDSFLGTP